MNKPSGERPPTLLTFAQFRRANVARCLKWHPAGIESWSPSDWLTAVAGELGELASLLKMRNRERDALPGNKFSPTQKQIADELADVLTYLDLLAEVLGVDLGAAAVEKFNEVSARVGFPDRIAPQPDHANSALLAQRDALVAAVGAIEEALCKDAKPPFNAGDARVYTLDGQTMGYAIKKARAALNLVREASKEKP
jgi:NTP pyrophosphatase (non-canonical NTP hydrolase)